VSKHGKRYLELRAKVEREREYAPGEAVALVRELSSAKFDESVEVHVRTGLNVRHADEQLRGTIRLARPRRPGPTSSAATTSLNGSRRASTNSTWRSPPPT